MLIKRSTFTLVETLVAVAVLSFGLILVCQGFLVVLGGFSYATDYLNILLWMDTKLWNAHDKLVHYRTLVADDNAGTVIIDGRQFNWALSYNLIEGTDEMSLYELSLRVFWREGVRKANLLRTQYALYVHE